MTQVGPFGRRGRIGPLAAALLLAAAGCSTDTDKKHGRVAAMEADTQARRTALEEDLAGLGSEKVLDRYRAIRSLLDLGRSADASIIEAIADPGTRVRASAKQAVLFLGDGSMAQPLFGSYRKARLEGKEQVCTSCLFALVALGKPAIPYLIRLLDGDRPTRVLAAYGLMEILELPSSGDLPGPDDPQLKTWWDDWWRRNADTFVDPADVLEPVSERATEFALALQQRDYFKACLAQQRYRILYCLSLGDPETAELTEPWKRTIQSLAALRQDGGLRPMDRDLISIMLGVSFELTGKAPEALDLLGQVQPGPEHGGGAPILQHLCELSRFWAYRRQGDNPKAAESLEAAIALLEAGAVKQSVGLRRLYKVHRRFFEEWSKVK